RRPHPAAMRVHHACGDPPHLLRLPLDKHPRLPPAWRRRAPDIRLPRPNASITIGVWIAGSNHLHDAPIDALAERASTLVPLHAPHERAGREAGDVPLAAC